MSTSVKVSQLPLIAVLEQLTRRLRVELYAISEERGNGLRARHYRMLWYLPAGGERVSDIAGRAGLTKQALAQTMVPLVSGGYVVVGPDPEDGRARIVRPTASGQELVRLLTARLAGVEREWSDELGRARWEGARAVLDEVAGSLLSSA